MEASIVFSVILSLILFLILCSFYFYVNLMLREYGRQAVIQIFNGAQTDQQIKRNIEENIVFIKNVRLLYECGSNDARVEIQAEWDGPAAPFFGVPGMGKTIQIVVEAKNLSGAEWIRERGVLNFGK